MNDTLNKKFYLGIAKSLLATGQYHGLAKLYISVLRRSKVLKRGAKKALTMGRFENPLGEISFTDPLSIANLVDSPEAWALAKKMVASGIPVATELDSRGLHRGTSIFDVRTQLWHLVGRCVGDVEILNLYRAWMSGHPKLLEFHELKRFNVIPKLQKRLNGERDDLECRLHQALVAQDGRIFAVAVNAHVLGEVLEQCEGGVVVGFAGTGSKVRINGTEVPTEWGVGKGLAVIGAEDLRSLLGPDVVQVTIETNLNHWLGWKDPKDGILRKPTSKRFGFYGSDDA